MAKRSRSRDDRIRSRRSIAHAAGIDIGATFHVVAVPAERDPMTGADLPQLHWRPAPACRLAARGRHHDRSRWSRPACTGSRCSRSWKRADSRSCSSTRATSKNVPGRKTDVNDAQWLQQLHQYGLLRGSFRPREAVVAAARLPAPPRAPRRVRGVAHPAHAEGADADERAAAPRRDATSRA